MIFWLRSPRATAVVTWAMLRTWLVRLVAIEFTESVRSFQVPATPGTSAWPPSMPSLPTSRATRVTSAANAESWSTMVLTVVFSSASSPLTSTVIFWLRSPPATAVVTWAMSRTWLVRLLAIEFTESVRSFHRPATPGTSAWPPRMPSVPTSRATRVTSSANVCRVAVIELSVSASSATSPRAVTVICWLRSPRATAWATEEMPRTWLVRLDAIVLTESVRSFQVPDTPRTSAWPPRRPSVPTSRATRVTSAANDDSWSTIRSTVSFSCAISPDTSMVTVRDRSPLATAVVTSAMSRTWAVSWDDMVLTASMRSRQVPSALRTRALPPSLPSVPTSRVTRVISSAIAASWSTRPLTLLATRSGSPRSGRPSTRTAIRWVRSPAETALTTRAKSSAGRTRSVTRLFAASIEVAQDPCPTPVARRSPWRPSRPASRRTRSSSVARCSCRSAISS